VCTFWPARNGCDRGSAVPVVFTLYPLPRPSRRAAKHIGLFPVALSRARQRTSEDIVPRFLVVFFFRPPFWKFDVVFRQLGLPRQMATEINTIIAKSSPLPYENTSSRQAASFIVVIQFHAKAASPPPTTRNPMLVRIRRSTRNADPKVQSALPPSALALSIGSAAHSSTFPPRYKHQLLILLTWSGKLPAGCSATARLLPPSSFTFCLQRCRFRRDFGA